MKHLLIFSIVVTTLEVVQLNSLQIPTVSVTLFHSRAAAVHLKLRYQTFNQENIGVCLWH